MKPHEFCFPSPRVVTPTATAGFLAMYLLDTSRTTLGIVVSCGRLERLEPAKSFAI